MSKAETDFLSRARPLAEALIGYAMTAGQAFGITDACVIVTASDSQKNSVENGQVAEVISGLKSRVTVTLYAGSRKLSFVRNSLDKATLCEAMLQNMQAIHVVPENADGRLLEKEKVYQGPLRDLGLYDETQPGQEELIAYAREAEAAALAQPGVKTAETVSVSKANSYGLVLATNGLDYHDSATSYQAEAAAIAEDAKGMQVDGEYSVARHFSDMSSPQALGKSAGRGAVAKLGAIKPATGTMPIVLNHDAAESFFSAVYDAIGGTAVFRGATFLKGRIGQQVMSRGVTLVDDPCIVRGLASSQVDNAGMESKKIAFIEDGVLESYVVSLQEARQLGIEPIGRDGGLTNSCVRPGRQTPEELIGDIKEGIYIKGFNGGTVNVNNGLHSRPAYGVLIRDGKITDIAVDGFVVSGNLKDMFMNVALANDTPPVPSTQHVLAAPTTRINGVVIAGK